MTATWKDVGAVGLLVMIIASVGALALAGGAAATVTTDTANFTNITDDELANQTLDVTNDTRSLYVELDNDTYNATGPANVTVFGIDNGTETQVDKVQIEAAANSTEMYEYTSIDTANYSSYRVLVEGNSSDIETAAIDIGTVAEVSSGGGWLDGGSSSVGVVGLLVVAGLVLFARD
ncbi:hypothetical protein [Haloferax sp. YSMS24]|uniref:hypothetical protein n=1 Tax=Haloferax sp. YSMS24 TaxID=3388425 RepID=UPI00398D1833